MIARALYRWIEDCGDQIVNSLERAKHRVSSSRTIHCGENKAEPQAGVNRPGAAEWGYRRQEQVETGTNWFPRHGFTCPETPFIPYLIVSTV